MWKCAALGVTASLLGLALRKEREEQALLLGLSGNSFPFSAFLAGAVTNAIPGILLQLVLIPSLMLALDRTKLVPFQRQDEKQSFCRAI